LDSALESVKKNEYERYRSFYKTHMTKQGNKFVAEQLVSAMTKEGDVE